jgi:UDP:flavonoid glycosyltransferase YjiC (YdhE family)
VKVLACVSGVGRGHAARCRPILEELRVRGHDCVAAVPGRRAGSLLAPICPVLLPPEGFHDRVAPPAANGLAYTCIYDFEMSFSFYQRDVLDSTRAVVAFVNEALETARPDVVLVDQVPPATALARGRGLPVVQITHGPFVPDHGPWAYWVPARPAELRYPPALPAVNAALEEIGAPTIERLDELLSGELTVIPTPAGLGTVDGALHVDVPALLDVTQVELSRRAGRPLVALLLGTTPHLLEEAVRGTLAAGADAVVVEAGDPLGAGPAVQTVGRVDAAAILRQVDAVVHHGGSGTIVTCLQAGVPSVAIPTHGEQAFNARRTAELGLGATVPVSDEPLEPVAIRAHVVTLAHRRPHRLAERLAAALQELDRPRDPALPEAGAGTVVDAIEELG